MAAGAPSGRTWCCWPAVSLLDPLLIVLLRLCRATMATAAPSGRTWCCRARPTPRSLAPMSTSRGALRSRGCAASSADTMLLFPHRRGGACHYIGPQRPTRCGFASTMLVPHPRGGACHHIGSQWPILRAGCMCPGRGPLSRDPVVHVDVHTPQMYGYVWSNSDSGRLMSNTTACRPRSERCRCQAMRGTTGRSFARCPRSSARSCPTTRRM